MGNPEDIAGLERMAYALRAKGKYEKALSIFERLAAHRKKDKIANVLAPGSPAWQIDIASLHWLLDDHLKAIRSMRSLVAGILDGSIRYGDAAGGMSQGLLLYYMAITDNVLEEASFALDYLRNRVKRTIDYIWPCPVARYYLGDIAFETVVEAVNRRATLARPLDPAKAGLLRRRRLSVALFHDGIRSRAQGDEAQCLARMRECYGLEDPLIEQEWYLARYEAQKAADRAAGAINPST
jgi:hypothetical protein